MTASRTMLIVALDWRLYFRGLRVQAHSNAIAFAAGALILANICGEAFSLGEAESLSASAGHTTVAFALLVWVSLGAAVAATWVSGVLLFLLQLRISQPGAFPPKGARVPILLFGRHLLPVTVALSPLSSYCLGASPGWRHSHVLPGVVLVAWSAAAIAFILASLWTHSRAATLACLFLLIAIVFAPTSRAEGLIVGGLYRILRKGEARATLLAGFCALVLIVAVGLVGTLVRGAERDTGWREGERLTRAVSWAAAHISQPYLRREVLLAFRWHRMLAMIIFVFAAAGFFAFHPARFSVHPELLLLALIMGPVFLSAFLLNGFAIEGPGLQRLVTPPCALDEVFASKEHLVGGLCVLAALPTVLVLAVGLAPAPSITSCVLVAASFVSYFLATCAAGRVTSLLFPHPSSALTLGGDLLPAPTLVLSVFQAGFFVGIPVFLLSRSAQHLPVPSPLFAAIALLGVSAAWWALARRASRSLFRARLENVVDVSVLQARGARAAT